MGSVKSLVLAGAAALVMIPGALAADLGAPMPPPILPRVQAPVEEFASGWYLRGDVGVGRQEFKDFAFTQTNSTFVWPASWRIDQKDIKDTAFVGFGIGSSGTTGCASTRPVNTAPPARAR
jgi:opacity protein-like surface antigen